MQKSLLWIPPELKAALTCDLYVYLSGNAIILVGGQEGVAQPPRHANRH